MSWIWWIVLGLVGARLATSAWRHRHWQSETADDGWAAGNGSVGGDASGDHRDNLAYPFWDDGRRPVWDSDACCAHQTGYCPPVNIDGTPMVDCFIDIEGKPFGVAGSSWDDDWRRGIDGDFGGLDSRW